MIRGIQSAAAGMIAQMAGQDSTANNLANVNTAGYKRDVPSFGATLSGLLGAAPTSRIVAGSGVDFSQGPLQETGNPLNLALEGDGFFAVQTAAGPAYTRDGSFTMDSAGFLVTASGDRVLGNAGPIRLKGGDFQVSGAGQIVENGVPVDSLRVVRFMNPSALAKIGGNLWSGAGGIAVPASGTRVWQGSLEGSNVNSVGEMVSMITDMRAYETSQKAIQAQDETLDKLVNDVGRVG